LQLVVNVVELAAVSSNDELIDKRCIGRLEELWQMGVPVIVYSTGTMSEVLQNGCSVLQYLVADNLQTFGHDQGAEKLETCGGDVHKRITFAFGEVNGKRRWQDEAHLVIARHGGTCVAPENELILRVGDRIIPDCEALAEILVWLNSLARQRNNNGR
jgi:hypothetical protein